MSSTGISSISQNQDKDALWVGTESGNIFKITLSEGHLKSESLDSYIPLLSQKKLKILSITETSQNIMWIGTDGDGIYKFLTKERLFNSITYGPDGSGTSFAEHCAGVYMRMPENCMWVQGEGD